MNLISVGNETIRIYKEGKYEVGGQTVMLPEGYDKAEIITPEMGEELLKKES